MLSFALSCLISIASWLPVITVIITVHELGHFLAARSFGVAVERFSIGFGRTVWARVDRYGTEWRIAWIPVGGYVRFAADSNIASVPDTDDLEELRAQIIAHEGPGAEKKYFAFKPLWQRMVVTAAGPLANFVLASLIFAVLMGAIGDIVIKPQVGAVEPGTPAAAAGLKPGDLITATDGHALTSFDDLHTYVMLRARLPITLTVDRGGQVLHLVATPAEQTVTDPFMGRQTIGLLGVHPAAGPDAIRRVRYGPVEALVGGVRRTGDTIGTTLFYIGRLVRGQVSGAQISGPIGTAQAAGAVARAGAENAKDLPTAILGVTIGLFSLAALLSVGVGFVNLLPIPVLDGGHLAFYAYEAAARRPLPASVQALSYRVGLALVAGLMLFASTNDLRRNNVFHFLGGPFS